MVRHDDECFEFVVLQMLCAVVDGIHYQLRDGLLFQVERSTTGGVEISVHPDKGLSRVLFVLAAGRVRVAGSRGDAT